LEGGDGADPAASVAAHPKLPEMGGHRRTRRDGRTPVLGVRGGKEVRVEDAVDAAVWIPPKTPNILSLVGANPIPFLSPMKREL